MVLELSENEGLEEVSQLQRELDLYLTLPKPLEGSKVSYHDHSDLFEI